MVEFEEELTKFEELINRSRRNFKKALVDYWRAIDAYDKLIRTRDELLQNYLKDRGWAICSEIHAEGELKKYPQPEDWGIYPRAQMQLYFKKLGSGTGTETHVGLYCPRHFRIKQQQNLNGKQTLMIGEVKMEKGRYILVANNTDITQIIKAGGAGIEPNGRIHPEDAVYRYLGIPDLPPGPDIEALRQGR